MTTHKQVILSKQAPDPVGPYNQAIQVGSMLYASGQIALNPETGEMNNVTFEAEVHQVLANVNAVLAAANMTFSNVVKATVFLTDMGTFPIFNAIYGEYLPEPFPARSTIEVAGLPKGARIEIEVIASA